MTDRIGSVSGARSARSARRKRASDAAAAAESAKASEGPTAAAPIPPIDPRPEDAASTLSAQLMGQSGPAEGAAPANSAARRAHSAYLDVEWSGARDRRNRRGRIAKTDV
jgi:hypothetical protein